MKRPPEESPSVTTVPSGGDETHPPSGSRAGSGDPTPSEERWPTRLGPHEVRGLLGRGAAGIVLRAWDPRREREVAIKLLRSRAASALARMQREVRALSRLEHPHVVRVHHVGQHEGAPFLVMDLIEGPTLEACLRREGPLPIDRAVRLAWRLALVLHYAHGHGVLHRDVKPANVLLKLDGAPVLTDFSLAKLRDDTALSRITLRGDRLGTAGFWPPEQACGDTAAIGPHSDVYGLGATLYAMLTGRPPFNERAVALQLLATLRREPARPSTLRAEVGPELERLVMACLAKDPARRPGCAALALELARLGGTELAGG